MDKYKIKEMLAAIILVLITTVSFIGVMFGSTIVQVLSGVGWFLTAGAMYKSWR